MRCQFEDFVKECGLKAIEDITEKDDNADPKKYVDTVLSVHSRFTKIVVEVFSNDAGFQTSFDKVKH